MLRLLFAALLMLAMIAVCFFTCTSPCSAGERPVIVERVTVDRGSLGLRRSVTRERFVTRQVDFLRVPGRFVSDPRFDRQLLFVPSRNSFLFAPELQPVFVLPLRR